MIFIIKITFKKDNIFEIICNIKLDMKIYFYSDLSKMFRKN